MPEPAMTHSPLATRPTVSPYRHLLGAVAEAWPDVLDRLRWDLNPLSRVHRARLAAWKDRFPGGKAVVLCNGPSLNRVDFDALRGCFTFGLNKINLLFDRTDFRPSCVVAVNGHVLEQNAAFYNATDLPLFLDSAAHRMVGSRGNVHFLHSSHQPKFARDCSISVSQGATVTFVALQLAFHMGFRRVALVGCDHSFAVKGPANATVVAGAVDHSHFDPNYFAGGVQWQLPDLLTSEVSYTMAEQVFRASGGEVVNSTDGGRLEVFRRQSLAEFLAAA
jgi:hypothetical protein